VAQRHDQRGQPRPALGADQELVEQREETLLVGLHLVGRRVVESYAYARTGYHRGLDALRRSGWKGHGPVPFEHEPNRGFLRALALLALSARAIGETDEWERCATFLRDSSPTAADELLT
jgi:hypothetical protein